MLQAIDISLTRGDQKLFEHLTCTVHPGQKVGLIGRNGAGKSTLFELVLGRLLPEAGDMQIPPGWRVAHMAQQVEVTEREALAYVVDGHRELRRVEQQLRHAERRQQPMELARLHGEFEDLGGYSAEARAGEILNGLGFAAGDFQRPFRAFSGGWRIRLNLAQALMCPADLLLLDEPTNHLDLDTTLWLEGWLKRFAGTLLVIAHDREFLDSVTDHTVHLHDGRADSYRGNYSSFERQRSEALTHQQAAFVRQQAEIRHMQSFVERFRAKASKARQAQSRLKALEKMQMVAPVYADSPYQFAFTDPVRMSNPLLSLRDVAIGYDGRPVLSGVSRSVLQGARIGILGANGAGKTTLLKCLVGTLAPLAGELSRGQHARVGYFAQHQLETLAADASPLEQVGKAHPDRREQWCRDYLGSWGFPARLAERPVATLSGGEKARLALAMIALTQPALLVLDEPTNHLDLDMREALGLALQDYSGALLLVSHDRALLKRTVDEFWLVEDGAVTPFQGDLDSYAAARAAAGSRKPVQHDRREERRASAARREREKPLRAEVRRHEAQMESLGRKLEAVEARLADPDVYQSLPAPELDELLAEAGRLRRELERAEQGWLEASESLETLESG